ncbi:MAG TPA: hypothetical protein DEF00_03955 [Candidatus Taylorbacteria bacterium]|nr:MAG: hypothetical protein UY03_C0012G0023 [Parcubacteria group bacterium GW2011_GWA2_47_64]KKU96909.1 MAG: hypothetical protein UY29_C0005G0042 [Parcubacteria group bacterium GW2011_GWC2_48_17]HBV01509.1 hypothetical protein [Candidatus Taylorbacteria bacterium]
MVLTMIDDTKKFLDVALEAVKKAEPIFKRYFGNPGEVHAKGNNPRNWVTDVDREIEQLIVAEIKRQFPHHGIVGEEFSPNAPVSETYTWYLDPIDGTSLYIHGIPFCCISIGLADKTGPLVGVISNPQTGELFHAVRGIGAFKSGKPITVSKVSDFNLSFGALGWGTRKEASELFAKLIPNIGKIRVLGSSAMQLCFLAEGKLDFYVVTGVHAWDIAAGILIASEAGAKISDFEGNPYTLSAPEKMLSTNTHLHSQFFEAIQKSLDKS